MTDVSGAIPEWFRIDYADDVHHQFQQMGSQAMNTLRRKTNVRGESTKFRKIGKGTATQKARHGTIPPMNAQFENKTATLADWYAGQWVDDLDELKHDLDERGALAKTSAYALGRKMDSIIYTAMDGLSSSALTLTSRAALRNSLIEMREALASNDVPDDGNVWCPTPPRLFSWLLTLDEFAQAEYRGPDLPYNGAMGKRIHTWNRCNFFEASEASVPTNGTSWSIFMYHYNAVGCASGQDIKLDITWQGTHAAYWVNSYMSMGAVVIDDTGVVKRTLVDATALPTS